MTEIFSYSESKQQNFPTVLELIKKPRHIVNTLIHMTWMTVNLHRYSMGIIFTSTTIKPKKKCP